MRRHPFALLALLLALVLAVIAAGCGGDDEGDEEATPGTTTEEAAGGNVSGTITVMAVWTGAEGESFQAVLDGFKEKYPNVTVKYRPSTNISQDLATSIEGGNPPDIAALPSPGTLSDFARRGALKPLDFAQNTVKQNYNQGWIDAGTVDGKLYGLYFKATNKSTVWYNVAAFEDAGIEPPETWEELLEAAETLKQSGVPAYSIGGSDGWTLTDLFENIYLRTAGPQKFSQLTTHKIPWTDPSVKEALTEMGKVFADKENIAGGVSGALQTDFPTSISNVFRNPPRAAISFGADFYPANAETTLEPQTGYNYFPFPRIGDSPEDAVLGGGDVVGMFKDSPAARAMMEYLASPEAQEVWAGRGSYTAPNKNVSADVYKDELTKTAASDLAQAGSFRLDLSDLQPSEFGGDKMFQAFQDFLKNPKDVDGTAQRLEKAAAAAYGRQ